MKKLAFLFLVLFISNGMAAQTQAEMDKEAYKTLKEADNELNKVYKELLKVLNGKEIKMLKEAQLAWIKFRDLHCDFEAQQYEGGSIQPLIRTNCLEECTRKRITDLKLSLEDKNR